MQSRWVGLLFGWGKKRVGTHGAVGADDIVAHQCGQLRVAHGVSRARANESVGGLKVLHHDVWGEQLVCQSLVGMEQLFAFLDRFQRQQPPDKHVQTN